MMASFSSHQSYNSRGGGQNPLVAQDYNQDFVASLEPPTQPSLCSQSPFLQPPADFASPEEQQQVVIASNDLPVSDMDLANFLEMDDKALSELTGVNSAEWNSLFNGQLDDMSTLDPMNEVQVDPPMMCGADCSTMLPANPQPVGASGQQPPHLDRWLVEETQKLERQQKLQQQKLLELQQTLLKTEILKNQLQIATISQAQSPTMSTTSSLLLSGMNTTAQQPSASASATSPHLPNSVPGGPGGNFNLSPNPNPVRAPMFASSQASPALGTISAAPSMTVAGSTTSRGSRMSTSSSHALDSSDFFTETESKFTLMDTPPSSPLSSDPNSPEEPNKRKVHNLIEKKYRCSINDRICLLRDMVSKHSKDNKKLQKSAVLQKTIDFIHHLHNTIKKLQNENQHLREALAIATSGKTHLRSYSSPPNTPDGIPSGSEDSGNPSSPESNQSNSPTSKGGSIFGQFLRNPVRQSSASQYLMVVTLVALFFINPLTLSRHSHVLNLIGASPSGGVRTLNSLETEGDGVETTTGFGGLWGSLDVLMFLGFWSLRIFVAALCFGWMTLKSMPKVMANSQESLHFWRLRKQAEKDLENGEFATAKDNLEVALSIINRPIPSSYFGMVSGLLWSFFSHVLFQLVVGRGAVILASMFIRRKSDKEGTFSSPKKPVFGVTFDDVSATYHLLHQINLSSSNPAHLHGMGFFLALNALNFAEADRPFNRLSGRQLTEMYFAIGLQCHLSIPYGSSLPMWYYFFCFQNTSPSKYATPLKWAVTEPGKSFLLSGKWASDVAIASRLYQGNAALPPFSVTRAYCNELLCESFGHLLLPDHSPEGSMSSGSRDGDTALQSFKLILNLAKEANSCLLSSECSGSSNIKGAVGGSDSGFTVIQWWASVGIVSCYWLADKESSAEDYYPNIEALSEEMGAAVPSALQLAFKANRMYKRGPSSTANAPKVPLEVVLQLCATTSNSLESSVANLLQDHSNSTQTELHQLGLLQACDWLLGLKVTLWENHKRDDSVTQAICPGFYQDLDTLSKLVLLVPTARSRLHLYKGCYQLIAGANPIAAQAMLNSTGSASLIRRRPNNKDSAASENSPAVISQEHAMAKVVAYKHLPPSMESPHSLPPPSPVMRGFGPLPSPSTNQAHV